MVYKGHSSYYAEAYIYSFFFFRLCSLCYFHIIAREDLNLTIVVSFLASYSQQSNNQDFHNMLSNINS